MATNKTMLVRLSSALGLDRSIAWTIGSRVWSSVAGIISVAFVVRFLSPVEQGFYYTFGSIVAAQVFFELGLTSVILHSASHEAAYLSWNNDLLAGEEVAYGRLSTLFQRAGLWYGCAALLTIACLLPAGYYFFIHHQGARGTANWQLPWALLVLGTAFNLLLSPAVTLLEGVGLVRQVAALRFRQAMASSVILWLILIARGGLLGAAAGVCAQGLVAFSWLAWTKRKVVLALLRERPAPHARISWAKEIWPFQWRIALSWLSGYFIFQVFNPIVFAYRGPVEAGKMGLSLGICTAISMIGFAWINTKAVPFGQWIVRQNFEQLDRVFFRALLQSTVLLVVCFFMLYLAVVGLHARHIMIAERLLPMPGLIALFVAGILNHFMNAEAVYLRSHKREVLTLSAVIFGLANLAMARALAPHYGAVGVCIGYSINSFIIGFCYVTWIFLRKRREWHTAYVAINADSTSVPLE